jgi:hypothetical protein
MTEIDLYTIIEVLSETCYYNVGMTRELPFLHNLLYVNKGSYKCSLNRYKREECHMPVGCSEIIRYFKAKPSRLVIFVVNLGSNINSTNFVSTTFERLNNHTYTIKTCKVPLCEDNIRDFSHTRKRLSCEDCIKKITKIYKKSRSKTVASITFDICTLYNIVKQRKYCTNIVDNYAQNYVKTAFNRYISILSEVKLTRALNFYISFQCKAANIEQNEYLCRFLAEDKGNLKKYCDRTRNIIKPITDNIILFIERDIKFII